MNNKKSLSIILVIIVALGLGISYFVVSENAKSKPDNEYVTVKFKNASVGSILKAELTDEGKSKYPNAKKYSIYSEEGSKELSVIPGELEEEVTAYPKVTPGNMIQVFLYDEGGNLIIKLDSKVIK